MQVEDYLMDGESTEAKTSASNKLEAYNEVHNGTIACTPLRIIFVNDHDVIDISLRSIDSVEYTEPSLSEKQIKGSIFFILLGVGFGALLPLLQRASIIPSDLPSIIIPIFGVIGLLLIVIGASTLYNAYTNRRSKLSLHTPSGTYNFSAENSRLESIVHNLRYHEFNYGPNQTPRKQEPQTL